MMLTMRRAEVLTVTLLAITACSDSPGSPPPPTPTLATIVVNGPDSVAYADSGTVMAQAFDENGDPLSGIVFTWSTSDTTRATVGPAGQLLGISPGPIVVTATSDTISGSHPVTISGLRFTEVTAGDLGTCGATTSGQFFCWGVPHGYRPHRLPSPTSISSPGIGLDDTCGLTPAGGLSCWQSPDVPPRSIALPAPFSVVHLGSQHYCGLTVTQAAYCWGYNNLGQLGTGIPSDAATPALVTGGHSWKALSTAQGQTCAIAVADTILCWGFGVQSPSVLAGAPPAARIAAGFNHACAIGLDSLGYCWGDNSNGQLGNNSTAFSATPVLVAGGRKLRAIATGIGFTCGLTQSGAAFCWGANDMGQLGSGATAPDSVPLVVSGGLTFNSLSTGSAMHTCGVTPQGEVYCWGTNQNGELGSPPGPSATAPVLVFGQ